jgi:hypothetical protein
MIDYREVIAALDFVNMEVGKVDPMLAQEIACITNQLEHDWFTNNKWYKTRVKSVKRRKKVVVQQTSWEAPRLVYWQ